ncbi:MAG: hypothetical protein ACUVV6_09595, partial [Thermoplasmatota archaeon]
WSMELGEDHVTALGSAGVIGGGGGSGGPGGRGGPSGGSSAQPGASGSVGAPGAAGAKGGEGGAGRIRLDALVSRGTVQPPAYTSEPPRRPLAVAVSRVVSPEHLARWRSLNVSPSLDGEAGLRLELLDASSGEVLGEWWPTLEGIESFDIQKVSAPSLQMRATLLTNSSGLPRLDSWSLTWVPNAPPSAPADLEANGHPAGSPEVMNLTSLSPVFSWRFVDPDPGQLQGAFNISVRTAPGGGGELMWSLEREGNESRVVYGEGGASALPLSGGRDYFVSVRTRDTPLAGPMWGAASELRIHINAPPPPPLPLSPANRSLTNPARITLIWTESPDPEGAPVLYEWQVSAESGFSSPRATGLSDVARTEVELSPGIVYYWRVRSSDGLQSSEWSDVWSFRVSTNRPPSVSPLPSVSLSFSETRELNLSPYGSDPEDGSNLSWSARLTAGPGNQSQPPPLRVNVTSRVLRLTAGQVEGNFIVELEATDSEGLSGLGELRVIVSSAPPNRPPVLSLNGSRLRSGERLRIELLKHVHDEEPASLRWEVESESALLSARLEGSSLVLDAGKVAAETTATVVVRVYDRANQSDETRIVFTLLPASASGADGAGAWLPMAIGALFVALALVTALALWARRRRGRPVASRQPPGGGWDIGPEEETPAFRDGVPALDTLEPPEGPGDEAWVDELEMTGPPSTPAPAPLEREGGGAGGAEVEAPPPVPEPEWGGPGIPERRTGGEEKGAAASGPAGAGSSLEEILEMLSRK